MCNVMFSTSSVTNWWDQNHIYLELGCMLTNVKDNNIETELMQWKGINRIYELIVTMFLNI